MNILDIDNCKSYATQENLLKALKKHQISDFRYLVVKNTQNRWTAIFPFSNIKDGNVTLFARYGFMTLG
jgi:hypothetical protein